MWQYRTYVRADDITSVRSRAEYAEVGRLVEKGECDKEISRATGVPRRTVSDWRRGKSVIWRRSECDGCGTAKHDFSELPSAPYAYLLGLYLGDGCISPAPRRVYRMRIVLDSKYPRIIDECGEVLESVFPEKTAHRYKRPCNCVEISMYSKHWPCFFPQHGPGRKHLRAIRLTGWQQAIVNENHRPFVKGLIHSDGTRIIATERKGSYVRRAPRYAFSNRSEDIKRLFCESCDAIGVRWTRPSNRQIAIYRKASVALLDEFVGPKC